MDGRILREFLTLELSSLSSGSLWNEGNFVPPIDNKGIRRIIVSESSEKFALGIKTCKLR